VDKTVYYLARAQASLGTSVRIFSITPKEPIPVPGVEVLTIKRMRANLLALRVESKWRRITS